MVERITTISQVAQIQALVITVVLLLETILLLDLRHEVTIALDIIVVAALEEITLLHEAIVELVLLVLSIIVVAVTEVTIRLEATVVLEAIVQKATTALVVVADHLQEHHVLQVHDLLQEEGINNSQ